MAATAVRDGIERQLKKLETKKNDAKEDLESVSSRKKTVRTLFKNEKDATGLQSTVDNVSSKFVSMNIVYSLRRKLKTCSY